MRRLLVSLAAAVALLAPVAGVTAAHADSSPFWTFPGAINGPITTAQLEADGSAPLTGAGPSTSAWEHFCSNVTLPNLCDIYGHDSYANRTDFFPSSASPFYNLRYSSKYLLLYNHNNGCMHVHKSTQSGGDWYDIVTCNTTDKNQRWSFPNGGQEIKASGDDACIQLEILFTIQTYNAQTCAASQSYQNFYWTS